MSSPGRLGNLWLILPSAILLLSIGWQVVAASRKQPASSDPILAKALPRELPGWTARELPLGETEETKAAVVETLQFDDYFSRSYRNGATEVTLYVAYWRPDKVPPRMVGVHTPDTCWIQNGWSCAQRTRAVLLTISDGHRLKPAEFGIYTLRENRQQVYFWHLVGGRPYSYEQEGLHSLTASLRDMASFGLNQRQEQLFVRLAANVPFAELERNVGYRHLLTALAELGLRAN